MIFTQKGQVFSLDFLISLVAVTAAIGLLIQAVELNTYYGKEAREFSELKAVTETAATLIVASDEMICDDAGQSLMNCIDAAGLDAALLADDIVPSGYSYEVEFDGALLGNITVPGTQDYYEVQRKVIDNPSSPVEKILRVKVWKT